MNKINSEAIMKNKKEIIKEIIPQPPKESVETYNELLSKVKELKVVISDNTLSLKEIDNLLFEIEEFCKNEMLSGVDCKQIAHDLTQFIMFGMIRSEIVGRK
jgi:hypothetical protein